MLMHMKKSFRLMRCWRARMPLLVLPLAVSVDFSTSRYRHHVRAVKKVLLVVELYRIWCGELLTSVDDSEYGEYVGWYVVDNHIWPRSVVRVRAANKSRDVVSLCQDEVGHNDLQQRTGKYDQGLDQVASSSLTACETCGAHHADLAGEIAHNGKDAGGI